jgi:hypothetical protein
MKTVSRSSIYDINGTPFMQGYGRKLFATLKNQKQLESEIIQDMHILCPFSQITDRTITVNDIQRALVDGFEDANILRTIMCMNNTMLYLPSSGKSNNFKVRRYLENLYQIGDDSYDSYAMSADVRPGGYGLFVVKSPRNMETRDYFYDNLLHEYFVMAFGTNKLRDRIPNFAFGMGWFQCSPPYIENLSYVDIMDTRNSALTFCQNKVRDNQVNFILYENITNSMTLKAYITSGCTFQEYINILCQTILSLDIAHQTIDFSHNDLHDANTLVRELTEEILIPYPVDINGTIKYWRTKYIATFIDFGRSHIKYQGTHFGYATVEYGLSEIESRPMYDIYKLIMFSLASSVFGTLQFSEYIKSGYVGLSDTELLKSNKIVNPEVFEYTKPLLYYFVPNVLEDHVVEFLIVMIDYLSNRGATYYSLHEYTYFNIQPVQFFEIILNLYPNKVISFMQDEPDNTPIYGCSNKGTCRNFDEVVYKYSRPKMINDVYSFYDLVTESQTDTAIIIDEGEIYYRDYYKQLLEDKLKYVDEYLYFNNYKIISLKTLPNHVIFNKIFLKEYRRYVAKSLRMIDIITTIHYIEHIVETLNMLYGNNIQENSHEFELVQEIEHINEIITSLKDDAEYVKFLNENTSSEKEIVWLLKQMPILLRAIHIIE